MHDVSVVGVGLTPAQQDATMADLVFFLEEFGSTRAVRVELQAQEREIKRFESQIRRFLGRQGDILSSEETDKDRINSSKDRVNTEESVDETMADLDFFLQRFGSTRAVRSQLESQRKELVGLKRTVKWFLERQTMPRESGGSGGVEYLGTEPARRGVALIEGGLEDAES
ncbi:hypothetical protein PHYPSEUDO_004913 [Phytophthora pseudosyringae]|uniref:Uncharacterized protein n=1 Tax=Phytophthora pseudosyringae TaxID=221518 RepID=A0A8T1WFN3_9STRA|nr:hypothetical protein PHYPSEUDO_004913 [Phytophthora pseudosyringae]